MIITVVADVLGKENNGTTIAAMNLIRFLKSQGHTVRILCGDQDKNGQENCFVVPNYNLGKLLNGYVEKVGVTLAKPDREVIEKAVEGADVVHIMVPLMLGTAASRVAREKNIPITAGFHMQAENFTSHFKMNKLPLANKLVYKVIYKKVYKYVDCIHFPTKFIRDTFERNIKKTTRGRVISNGVNAYVQKYDAPKLPEYKDKIMLLSIGRLASEKAQDTLIKAVKYSKYKDKIVVVLAGLGAKEKKYRKIAKKYGTNVQFKFFGRKEVVDMINMCDLYIHPAVVELEGIACLEAITCGKLTIVSNSGLSATKDFVVDKRCIFKKHRPKDLARVIDFWLDNPKEKEICEQKYINQSKVVAQEECMKQMEQMLKDAIQNHDKVLEEINAKKKKKK